LTGSKNASGCCHWKSTLGSGWSACGCRWCDCWITHWNGEI